MNKIRKFILEDNSELFVGYADEIKSLYVSLVQNVCYITFIDKPYFRKKEIYGILIDENEIINLCVVNSSTITQLFMNGFIKKEVIFNRY